MNPHEVSKDEIIYRGRGAADEHKQGHAIQSRALLCLLLEFPGKKRFSPAIKAKSFRLLSDLVKQSASWGKLPFDGTISFNYVDGAGEPQSMSLVFNEAGFTQDLCNLPRQNPKCARAWQRLAETTWNGHRLTSTLELATLWDLWFFVCWSKHNASTGVWVQFGQQIYPCLIYSCGRLLDAFACHLSQRQAGPLPLLKSKMGNNRRLPKINKVLLLQRLRSQKRHRGEVMATHTDLTSSKASLVLNEQLITVCNYLSKTFNVFQDCNHISITWDASSYDIETMVILAYSHQCDTCAYLPLQQLLPVMTEEVDQSIQRLAFQGKAVRVEGFGTLRAVAHGLSFLGFDLDAFRTPSDLLLGPFQGHQERVLEGGTFYILDSRTGSKQQQIPEGCELAKLPMKPSQLEQDFPFFLVLLKKSKLENKLSACMVLRQSTTKIAFNERYGATQPAQP